MRLVLLGLPGVGKGTQASLIARESNTPHYSTGDIFREILKSSSLLSRKVAKYVNEGELVPDDIVFEMVKKFIAGDEVNANGWVLDGFPRNKRQAEMLDDLLEEESHRLNFAIHLTVSRDILVNRLYGRRVCSNCGAIYNLSMNPTQKEGICDKCGGMLERRKDDSKETILKRISIFESEFLPLRKYYQDQGILIEVNGESRVQDVFNQIKERLEIGQERRN